MPALLSLRFVPCAIALASMVAVQAVAQERLSRMPGVAYHDQMLAKREGAYRYGRLSAHWTEDGMHFTAEREGRAQSFDMGTLTWSDKGVGDEASPRPGRMGLERGRQFDSVTTADGSLRAFSRNRNVYLRTKNGTETAVTTEGSVEKRIKFGTGSWVYGEELEQHDAMWFSPNGQKLAFYRFDESAVKDYFVAYSQTAIQDRLNTEPYPKAGAPNPIPDLFVYDVTSKSTVTLDVRFGDAEMGHYVYAVQWSPDGSELLFFRMNRRQNRMQFCAGNPTTGKCRTILEESYPKGWVPYKPGSEWSDTGQAPLFVSTPGKPATRFVWISEADGFRNAVLYDLSGKRLNTITANAFDLQSLIQVDPAGYLWYTAHDGVYPAMLELHRVKLDGTGDARLTDPALSHRVTVSPKGNAFVDIQEALDVLPTTTLCNASGRVLATLATSDDSKAKEAGIKPVQHINFLAADGATVCYGKVSRPTNFDPTRRYPLIVSVYGGPESSGVGETFEPSDDMADYGFIVAWFDGRGTFGRGRAFRQAVYGKLGGVDIDDQAAGVKALIQAGNVDADRVGIHGASYGGYASLMALLRYPTLFRAAECGSPVTRWQNYDSTYTERYMGLPEENASGYRAGSAMSFAKAKVGALLLYFGTADNNVHPSNTLQFIRALGELGKGYELAIGPDREHSDVDEPRLVEFFIEHLVLEPAK